MKGKLIEHIVTLMSKPAQKKIVLETSLSPQQKMRTRNQISPGQIVQGVL